MIEIVKGYKGEVLIVIITYNNAIYCKHYDFYNHICSNRPCFDFPIQR